MANMSTASTQLDKPGRDELAEAILKALAKVRAMSVQELLEDRQPDGDLEIDSREAEAVIAMLEKQFGRTLAKVEDLEPECLPSVESLAELLHRRWPGARSTARHGSK